MTAINLDARNILLTLHVCCIVGVVYVDDSLAPLLVRKAKNFNVRFCNKPWRTKMFQMQVRFMKFCQDFSASQSPSLCRIRFQSRCSRNGHFSGPGLDARNHGAHLLSRGSCSHVSIVQGWLVYNKQGGVFPESSLLSLNSHRRRYCLCDFQRQSVRGRPLYRPL